MKFLALLSLAATGLAVPTAQRTPQYPTPLSVSAYSTLNVNTGAVDYRTSSLLIKRTPSTEISHLATFAFPAATAGKTCHIYFSLPASGTVSGSKQADVFTVGGNPTKSTTGFPREFYRDTLIGRFTAQPGGVSYLQAAGQEFPCPAGQTKTFEAVPAGEAVEIAGPTGIGGGLQVRYW